MNLRVIQQSRRASEVGCFTENHVVSRRFALVSAMTVRLLPMWMNPGAAGPLHSEGVAPGQPRLFSTLS